MDFEGRKTSPLLGKRGINAKFVPDAFVSDPCRRRHPDHENPKFISYIKINRMKKLFWMGVLLIFAIFLTIYFFIYWRKR